MRAPKLPHLSPEFTDGRVTVAPGVELAYVDRGSGPAIVLVPGWTFAKEIFEKQIPALARKYRVIAYDPRSQGASSFALEGNDYQTHAEDLAALLQSLDVRNPVLVGWSAGAHTTWGYIKTYGPESIAAHVVIDISPKCLSDQKDSWVEGSVDEIAAFHTVYMRDTKGLADYMNLYTETVMIERGLQPEELDWIVNQSLKTPPLVAGQLFASCMFQDNIAAAVSVAKARPTLFFVAQHWSKRAVPYLRNLVPESKIVSFGGHMLFWEHPEAFNRVLDEFIQQCPVYGVPEEIA